MSASRGPFRDLSINHKLVLIILAISATILFLTAALSLISTIVEGRQRLLRSTAVNAQLLGEYCVVPLSFEDRDEAARMLARVQTLPDIYQAVLFDAKGAVFASYNPRSLPMPVAGPGGGDRHAFGPRSLTYAHAVVFQGDSLGTLSLQAGTDRLRQEALRFAGIIALLFCGLIALTYLLALQMQGIISRPILGLADAFRRVSDQGDLSQRVDWSGKDEFGTLYAGFNHMLDQLEARQGERDRAEEQARMRHQQLIQAGKLVTLGTLVSGVAHEINNPNAFIMLNASLALKQWKDMEAKRIAAGGAYTPPDPEMCKRFSSVLENVYQGSKRIDGIVKRLKDYYRKDLGRVREPLDLNVVAAKAIEILDAKIRKADIAFRFDAAVGLPAVSGNFQELEQVLINLIENACQALPAEGGSVTVRIAAGEGEVRIEVEDSGLGIPPENLERITDPFFTTKREAGGTGLGLSLALAIVTDHGGSLRFSPAAVRGTIARLTLPAAS